MRTSLYTDRYVAIVDDAIGRSAWNVKFLSRYFYFHDYLDYLQYVFDSL